MMKKIVVGILVHVDAGKTTLSEGILYLSGKIGKLGRVDNKDAYLDTYELERARGIIIFSKHAIFETGGIHITLVTGKAHNKHTQGGTSGRLPGVQCVRA